jgi:hypothetical protein
LFSHDFQFFDPSLTLLQDRELAFFKVRLLRLLQSNLYSFVSSAKSLGT